MKSTRLLAALLATGLMVSMASTAHALDVGLGYGTYTGLGTKDLREGVMAIINIAFGFLGILAIAGIIFGGFLYMTSGGNTDRTSSGIKVAVAGVVGLIIIFCAYAIASFVITQLMSATGA